MTTSLAVPRDVLTADQLELVKRTVAVGATPDELLLFLNDCRRQGVHPLDKLLHFTKRDGRYTPITSIDFMRIRAAETSEYAGSDDAQFIAGESYPLEAHVTVWRLVQGQRCAFSATARWSEYYPGDKQGFMWRKMPHTMLAKCAEALALRKGFPRQLAGLYAREELDQAERSEPPPVAYAVEPMRDPDAGAPAQDTVQQTAPPPALPPGTVRIERVNAVKTKNPKVLKYFLTLSTGEEAQTINARLAAVAEAVCEANEPVVVVLKGTKWGSEVESIKRLEADDQQPELGMLDDSDIPF